MKLIGTTKVLQVRSDSNTMYLFKILYVYIFYELLLIPFQNHIDAIVFL